MTPALEHLADNDTGKRRRNRRHGFHLESGERELLGKLRRRHGERREFPHPVIRDLHGNCFRNRKSFSKNNRRSSTP